MEVMSGTVKGMGYALAPMLVSICCICGIRIAWILLVFPTERFHSIIGLYITYPISWTAALIGMVVIAFFAFSSLKKMDVKKGSESKQKQLSEIK